MASILGPETPKEQRDIWEQIVRINALQTDTNLKQQQQRFAPWQLAFTGMAAGGGILAAGAALMKLMLG